MNLMANENFPRLAVEALRAAGHNVCWARTEMPGASDQDILARARLESRSLMSFDKDFGELAFRAGLPAPCGVFLFRFVPQSPDFVAARAVAVLRTRVDWQGQFVVVEESRIRARPMSKPS